MNRFLGRDDWADKRPQGVGNRTLTIRVYCSPVWGNIRYLGTDSQGLTCQGAVLGAALAKYVSEHA